MREARLILPVQGNDGQELLPFHLLLRRMLVRTWGGYNSSHVTGGWVDHAGTLYEDEGIAYDVAMEPHEGNNQILRSLAVDFGSRMGQLGVYLRYPSGDVEILDLEEELRAEQAA